MSSPLAYPETVKNSSVTLLDFICNWSFHSGSPSCSAVRYNRNVKLRNFFLGLLGITLAGFIFGIWFEFQNSPLERLPIQPTAIPTSEDILTGDAIQAWSEPSKRVTLSGYLVHDLNGDGIFNPNEPVIPNAEICLIRERLDPLCVQTNRNGRYSFGEIIPGAWRFRVFVESENRLSKFRYTNQLIEKDHQIPETSINGYTITKRKLNLTEFNPIENEILVLVDRNQEYNFFVMQGWATHFASQKDQGLFRTTSHYDLDIRIGRTRIYNGETGPTYDQHDGLDSACPKGTEILSVAEGRVIAIFYGSTVAIRHTNNQVSIYGHGKPLVEELQFVPRGYPVALCDQLLTSAEPHIHFAVWQNTPWLPRVIYGIPPYTDLTETTESWVQNTHPLDENYFHYILQGSPGIWTEINSPHPPYVRSP